jgi:hopanoid biosynthesis associated RND transporter like protein HpnN
VYLLKIDSSGSRAQSARACQRARGADGSAIINMNAQQDSWLMQPLRWLTRGVTRYPRVTIGAALALALVGLALAFLQLGLRTNRLDLISRESGFNQRWINYINEFGDRDDVVIVVEGRDAKDVVSAIDVLAEHLRTQSTDCEAMLWSIDPAPLRAKALYYLNDEQLAAAHKFAAQTAPIARGEWNRLNLQHTLSGLTAAIVYQRQMGNQPAVEQAAAHLSRTADAMLAAFEPTARYVSPWPATPQELASETAKRRYLLANEGRVGMILLRLKGDDQALAKHSDAIDRLRKTIATAQTKLTKVEIGLTGLPVLENDEMRLSERATIRAGVLSLVGVACLFIAGFGGLRYPLMTVGALLIALAWTMGYITLAVGHLNILTMSFGVILIGLGIDFGIHYIARYSQLRHELSTQEALEATAASVGPGVLVGAVTTAAAFFTAGFTDFTGVAELGVIAGGGVLLCMVVAIVVLPAMIRLAEGTNDQIRPPEPIAVDRWAGVLTRRPKLSLGVGLAITALLGLGVPWVWFDHNLLNLQADGLESVRWEQKLIHESDQSVWFAVSLANSREELIERKQAFQQLGSVERVEEIATWLPKTQPRHVEVVRELGRELSALPNHPDNIPVASVQQLAHVIGRCEQVASTAGLQPELVMKFRQLRQRMLTAQAADYYKRISWLQQSTAEELLVRLKLLAGAAAPEPPSLADLPAGLVTRFVGRNGRHLIKVYGRGNIWDMDSLAHFVKDVRSVDAEATGKPLQTYEASRQMQRSYIDAAMYALIAVVVVLLIDFRDPRLVLLAGLPLAFGIIQMFGLMGLLGIPLNAANLIVLPLILGIGIDDGVHVVHDFRRQHGANYRLSRSTASAILMTSLTTMVGFGSLMIASHRGLESLGRVLTLGVTCCLFSSLVILPALLSWLANSESALQTTDASDGIESLAQPQQSSQQTQAEPESVLFSETCSDRLIEPRRRSEQNNTRAA